MTGKFYISVLIFVLVAGCAGISFGKTVRQGQQVTVDYTCITEEGELIAATRLSEIENPSLKKSNGFIEHQIYRPVVLTAGKAAPGQWDDKLKKLEPELLTKIALQLPGMEIGKETEILLRSDIPEGMIEKNRYRIIEKVRKAPKMKFFTIVQYQKIFGDPLPEPGDIIPFNGKAVFKVNEVSQKRISLEAISERIESKTDLGRAVTQIEGDMVVTTIMAVPGTIVKTGPVIGEITEVTDDTIKVDYGHPFAGRTLKCRVKALEEGHQP